jgi:hypothetical protein
MRVRFVHESADTTREEVAYYEGQIKTLKLSSITTDGGRVVKVHRKMLLTMIDGKVCNAATNTASTMRCYVCGNTSKDFND